MTNEDRVAQRLGGRVRHFRLLADNMSQERLGDLIDYGEKRYSQSTVSEMELGEREINFSELGRIARALNVTTDQLTEGLGYTGEPIIVTGAGTAGLGDPDKKPKKKRKRG